jgi:hypothetical protein
MLKEAREQNPSHTWADSPLKKQHNDPTKINIKSKVQ